jgi:hypothetical protein
MSPEPAAAAPAAASTPATDGKPVEGKGADGKPVEGKAADGKAAEPAPKPTIVIEDKKRLSESLIWKLQRAFYASQGPAAWKPNGVPFYITSNPHIARCYSRVFAGALRDLLPVLQPGEPVYFVELAAGSGQFSYLHLKNLLRIKAALPELRDVPIRYVMTDFAQRNLDAWQKNQRLRELVDQGVLDFALFDMERDSQIQLVNAKQTITKGSCKNPLLAIANYAFDTTVQDAFFVKDGVLSEAVASVLSTQAEKDLADAAILGRSALRFDSSAMKGDRYDDPALNRVLERYARRLNNTCFLLPIGALHGIRTLRAWSGGRLFLLSADKAVSYEEDLLSRGDAGFAFHGGSVSMTVNFHALGAYFEEVGGAAMQSLPRSARLHVCGLASGVPDLPEARLAFDETMSGFGPAAYVKLVSDLRKEWKEPTLEAVAALLRLCFWDQEILIGFREALKKHLPAANDSMKLEILSALRHSYDNFYPMQYDLPFDLAGYCMMMKEPREALFYLQQSLQLYGEHFLTHFRAGLAHGLLGEMQEGIARLDKALALNPNHTSSREMKIRYEARLAP